MFAIAASVLAAVPNPQPPVVRPRATAVIVKGTRADAKAWLGNAPGTRREIVREENGHKVVIRVLEHE